MGSMPKSPFTALACAAALLAASTAAGEPAVIGMARAFLGPDSTLDGIQTIHFVGMLDRVDPNQPKDATVHATLDLVFSKPLRQRLVIRTDKTTVTTVLDGYDAWDFMESNTDPTRAQIKWLSATDIKVLRANTWESLYFYRGLQDGGVVEDKGTTTIDSVACERVDFNHGSGGVYERFFDRDTGRLVMTVRGPESIRESGEIRVDGLHFPKAIVSVTKTASGKELVSTVTFTRVTLNEPLDAGAFAAPDMTRLRKAPAATPPPTH